jgi:hypothetical protein
MDPNIIILEHYKSLIEINKEEKDKNQEKIYLLEILKSFLDEKIHISQIKNFDEQILKLKNKNKKNRRRNKNFI